MISQYITYEASLICDRCRMAIAGSPSQTARQARDSAIRAGLYRGWLIDIEHSPGVPVLCPTCKEKPKEPHEKD